MGNREEPTSARHLVALKSAETLSAGGLVVLVEEGRRESQGVLLFAADAATTRNVAFAVRHTTGILCAPMAAQRADALGLMPMVSSRSGDGRSDFAVPVDCRSVGSGLSACDRAMTFQALADPSTVATDLRHPGHVFPIRSAPNGVLERAGLPEAAVDLLRLSGRVPVGVMSGIVSREGGLMQVDELRAFAASRGMPLVTVTDVRSLRRASQRQPSIDLSAVERGVDRPVLTTVG